MQRVLGLGLLLGIGFCSLLRAEEYAPPAGNDPSNLYVLPSDDEPARPRSGRSGYLPAEGNLPATSAAPSNYLPAPPSAPNGPTGETASNSAYGSESPSIPSHRIGNDAASSLPAENSISTMPTSNGASPANFQAPVSSGIELSTQPALMSVPSQLPATTSAPTAAATSLPLAPRSEASKNLERPAASGNSNTLTGVAVSLGLVLGLFLLFAWFARGSLPQGMSRLPTEVLEPLGRMPLVGRQELHLLRLGNKLVLMALSPVGMEPICEVTDPAEVDRLLGICRQGSTGSSTAAFRDVVAQVSAEPTRGGFAGQFARAIPGASRRT